MRIFITVLLWWRVEGSFEVKATLGAWWTSCLGELCGSKKQGFGGCMGWT